MGSDAVGTGAIGTRGSGDVGGGVGCGGGARSCTGTGVGCTVGFSRSGISCGRRLGGTSIGGAGDCEEALVSVLDSAP